MPLKDFLIRSATQADCEGIEVLIEEIDAYHRAALPQVFRKPNDPQRTRDFLSSALSNPDAVIFIAGYQDKIVGLVYAYVRALPESPIRIPSRVGEVDQIVVTKECRRNGVGKALMEKVHQWADEMKLDRLELSVWDFNQGAWAFYRTLGYATTFHRMWKTGPFPNFRKIELDNHKPPL